VVETKLSVRVTVVGWPGIVTVVVEVAVEVSFCEGTAVKVSLCERIEEEVVPLADILVYSISVVSWKAPAGAVMLWLGPRRRTTGCKK
jgi:hypothetical protein